MATDRVIFNVGGTRFETTTQTVNSLPDNYFAKLIAASWRDVSATEIFIDRDPACFSHFLNYLRARVVPGGLSKKEWCALKVEAEYYDMLDVLPPDPDLEIVEELVPDDLVCLTPEAVEAVGLLVGRTPTPENFCGTCEYKQHLNYDVFGRTGRCPLCSKQLSGIWKCVEAELNHEYNRLSTAPPHLLNSLSGTRLKYLAEASTFTVRKVARSGKCVLLYSPGNPIPIEFRDGPPHAEYYIHIPYKYLKKIGHKKPEDDDYLNWTYEEIMERGEPPDSD